jgi:DNA-binding Lrp family transcriptional regulator
MRFSPRDLKIIHAAQTCADEPLAKLAKITGEKEHIVRRVISLALEKGALRRRVFTSSLDLGFQEYVIFFSSGARTVAQKNVLRDVLLEAPNVQLLLEVGGRFNFGVVLLAPSVLDFENFFNYIVSKSRIPITDVQLQMRTGWHFFGAKYLVQAPLSAPVHVVPSDKPLTLSSDESRILNTFATSENGKRAEMARSLGLSQATFQYQLDRLHARGIILDVRYQVVPEVFGYQPFRALVMTSLPLTAPRMQIMKWARHNPYVVTMMHGVGVWQYELRIEAPNYATAAMVVDELNEKFSSVIRSVELIPVLSVLKMQLHPACATTERSAAQKMSKSAKGFEQNP